MGGADAGAEGYGYWAVHYHYLDNPNQEIIDTVLAQDALDAWRKVKEQLNEDLL